MSIHLLCMLHFPFFYKDAAPRLYNIQYILTNNLFNFDAHETSYDILLNINNASARLKEKKKILIVQFYRRILTQLSEAINNQNPLNIK